MSRQIEFWREAWSNRSKAEVTLAIRAEKVRLMKGPFFSFVLHSSPLLQNRKDG